MKVIGLTICSLLLILATTLSVASPRRRSHHRELNSHSQSPHRSRPNQPNHAAPGPHRETIVQLAGAGLDSEDTVGFHGTSLEAIIYLEQHGHLPAGFSDNQQSIYFAPINSTLPNHPQVVLGGDSREEALEEARAYADHIARNHGFLAYLGLDIGNREHDFMAYQFFDENAGVLGPTYFRGLGFRTDELAAATRYARSRRGVVLALGSSVSTLDIQSGDGDATAPDDLKIRTGSEGLSIAHIVGIEPLGDAEWDHFFPAEEDQ